MPSSYTTPAGLFVDVTQARANQAAYTYACQQARNNRTANCAQPTGDMPLTSAIYLPSAGKIYGVRGGYLFEFDASGNYTGRSLAFGEMFVGNSFLAADGSGALWATNQMDAHNYERISAMGFYKFSLAGAMSVVQFFNTEVSDNANNGYPITQPGQQDGGDATGPTAFKFLNDGSIVALGVRSSFGSLCAVKLASDFSTMPVAGFLGEWAAPGYQAFYWDEALSRLWSCSGPGLGVSKIGAFAPPTLWVGVPGIGGTVFGTITQFDYYNPNIGGGTTSGAVYGLDYVLSVDNFFAVTRSTSLLILNKSNPAGGYTVISLAGARPNAKPRNIKYVAFKDRLYVPTMQDNAVVEVNPNTNTVTNVFVLPAGTIPWDIMDTGASVFAICLGPKGLVKVV